MWTMTIVWSGFRVTLCCIKICFYWTWKLRCVTILCVIRSQHWVSNIMKAGRKWMSNLGVHTQYGSLKIWNILLWLHIWQLDFVPIEVMSHDCEGILFHWQLFFFQKLKIRGATEKKTKHHIIGSLWGKPQVNVRFPFKGQLWGNNFHVLTSSWTGFCHVYPNPSIVYPPTTTCFIVGNFLTISKMFCNLKKTPNIQIRLKKGEIINVQGNVEGNLDNFEINTLLACSLALHHDILRCHMTWRPSYYPIYAPMI